MLAQAQWMRPMEVNDPLFSKIMSLADCLKAAAEPGVGALSAMQMNLLRCLEAAGRRGLSQAHLASACRTSAPTVTRLVDELSESQLVTRTRHPHDRRTNMVMLTDEGLRLLKDSSGRITEVEQRLRSSLSAAELSDLEAKLACLTSRAQDLFAGREAPQSAQQLGGGRSR